MDIYKRFGISTSFLDAIQTVTEKKHMDPVDPKQAKGAFKDRKDKDIDNDGKVTGTDKYLHTRRNAITKAMSEKKKGKKDVVDTEPKIDDKSDMRGVQEAERRADAKMVKARNPDGTMSFRKERPEIKVEEVEEIDELSKSTLGSYVKKRVKQVPSIEIGRQMAEPGRELKGYEKLKKKVNKGIGRAIDRLAKEDADLTQEDIDFINELNKVDELDKKTLDKYSTRARFSSNPKHREGALKAMDKIKDKSKNEK